MVLNKHDATTVFNYRQNSTHQPSKATYVAPDYLSLNHLLEDYLGLVAPAQWMLVSASLIPEDEQTILYHEPWDAETSGHLLTTTEEKHCYQLKYFFNNYDVLTYLKEHNITVCAPPDAESVFPHMMRFYEQILATRRALAPSEKPNYSIHKLNMYNNKGEETASSRYTMPSDIDLGYLIATVFPKFELSTGRTSAEGQEPLRTEWWLTPGALEYTYLENYLEDKIQAGKPLEKYEQEHMGRVLTFPEIDMLWRLQDALDDVDKSWLDTLERTPEFHALTPKSIDDVIDTLIGVYSLGILKGILDE